MKVIQPRSAWSVKKTSAMSGPYRRPGSMHWGWLAFAAIIFGIAIISSYLLVNY